MFTGEFVKHAAHSATAVFPFPEFNVNWAAKLAGPESSTATKITAVTNAFIFLLGTSYQCLYVNLCDSRCAVNRLTSPSPAEITTTVALWALEQLMDNKQKD